MGSTGGGFLIGFGACILLVGLGANMILGQYYGQVMAWKDEVQQIYSITHSSYYEAALNSLDALSPGANMVADRIEPIPFLNQYAPPLRLVGNAASTMRQVRQASENAYYAINAIEFAPQYLMYAMIFGIVLAGSGSILAVRARARAGKGPAHPPNPPPPPVRVCLKCGYVASPGQRFCSNCGFSLNLS